MVKVSRSPPFVCTACDNGAMNFRLAVVEDDGMIAESIRAHLEARLSAEVQVSATLAAGEPALAGADLIVLDLNLPDSSGVETVSRVRRIAPAALLIAVTARGSVADRVQGLRLGADDYLVKPFSLLELEARIEALLRRRAAPPSSDADIAWDRTGRRVRRSGVELALTPLEYEIFCALSGRPGQALARAEILRVVIGPNFYGYERVVDVHVGHLRKKLDPDDPYRYIGTVRHYGYRWDAPAPQEPTCAP